jgi:hypothetical protein
VADESDYANEDDAIEFEPKKEKRKRGRPKKTEAEKAATREGNAKRRNGIKAIAKGEDDGSGGGEESEDEDGDEGGGGEESRYETRVLVRSRLHVSESAYESPNDSVHDLYANRIGSKFIFC